MNKQQFKAMRSEYRQRAGLYVRNGRRALFGDLLEEMPLMVRCLPSDRPVSVGVWLKLHDMRRAKEGVAA
ncbi:hypothetical protein [Duffyella gerundensis]|uniref:hypothetical protein n=1 Tax=Duffyella TaxID=3026546 RepID=UPI003F6E42B9